MTGIVVSPAELASEPGWIVFDCRFSLFDKDAGRSAYTAGHIPGARFADLEQDLSAPAGPAGRHPLPDREALAERLRAFGVNDDSSVVCYDQNSGAVAARLWWLLRWLGHGATSLLDGGIDAWLAAGLPTTTDVPGPARGNFSVREPLTRTCTADDLPDASLQLLDAREPARYRGESEPIDPVAGHIPGAISAPFADNVDNSQFKSPAALRTHFATLGVDADKPIACYCGSGVTAAHDIIALKLAGFPEPALYPGSWSEWIANPSRPIERCIATRRPIK